MPYGQYDYAGQLERMARGRLGGGGGMSTPDYSQVLGNLGSYSDLLNGMFSAGGKQDYLSGMRSNAMSSIGQAGAGARRGLTAQSAAGGMYDSSPLTSGLQQTYQDEQSALSNMETGLGQAGLSYDQLMMQGLGQQSSIQNMIAQILGGEFGGELAGGQFNSDEFYKLIDLISGMASYQGAGGRF